MQLLMPPERETIMSEAFIEYLMCDTFIMLEDGEDLVTSNASDDHISDHFSQEEDPIFHTEEDFTFERELAAGSDSSSNSSSQDIDLHPHFPDLQKWIKDSIEFLGGSVFVKVDNVSAIDARWAIGGNCCCSSSLNDVITLLKSSDRIRTYIENFMSANNGILKSSADEHDIFRKTIPVLRLIKFEPQINQLYEFRVFLSLYSIIGCCCKYGLYSQDLAKRPEHYNCIISQFIYDSLLPKMRQTNRIYCESQVFVADLALKNDDKFLLIDLVDMDKQPEINLVFFHHEEFRNYNSTANFDVNLEAPLKQCSKIRYLSENCDQRTNLYPMNNIPLDML